MEERCPASAGAAAAAATGAGLVCASTFPCFTFVPLAGHRQPQVKRKPWAAQRSMSVKDAPREQRRRGAFATAMDSGLRLLVLKLLFALVIVLILTSALQSVIGSLPGVGRAGKVQPLQQSPLPVPQDIGSAGVLQEAGAQLARQGEAIDHSTGTTIVDRPHGMSDSQPPTAEEIRERQRRADEAARIIEANTPEM